MQRFRFAAIALAATGFAGCAHAEGFDARDLFWRAQELVESLIGRPAPDRDVIVPPGNIDRKMALMPPCGGTLRLLAPPDRFRQR